MADANTELVISKSPQEISQKIQNIQNQDTHYLASLDELVKDAFEVINLCEKDRTWSAQKKTSVEDVLVASFGADRTW